VHLLDGGGEGRAGGARLVLDALDKVAAKAEGLLRAGRGALALEALVAVAGEVVRPDEVPGAAFAVFEPFLQSCGCCQSPHRKGGCLCAPGPEACCRSVLAHVWLEFGSAGAWQRARRPAVRRVAACRLLCAEGCGLARQVLCGRRLPTAACWAGWPLRWSAPSRCASRAAARCDAQHAGGLRIGSCKLPHPAVTCSLQQTEVVQLSSVFGQC
jgi:hypothetical protein